jgi:hypothetical protein
MVLDIMYMTKHQVDATPATDRPAFEITEKAFALAYSVWREALADSEFPEPPVAPWSSDSLFQILQSASRDETPQKDR